MLIKRDVESDCPEENFLQALINNKESINMNEFKDASDFNYDPYKKTRTYGLQRIIEKDNNR